MARITVKVEDLEDGDVFVGDDGYRHYTVEVVEELDGEIVAEVRFADGGNGQRAWAPGTEITVERTS